MTNTRLTEHGRFVEGKRPNGHFPIRIIVEGSGQSGEYLREALENPDSRNVFSGLPMFANHPPDPEKPWTRDVTTIMGRVGQTIEYKILPDGKAAVDSEMIPDSRWASFVEENKDLLDISIYVAGKPKRDESNQPVLNDRGFPLVESFVGGDPFNSVDVVVAGGAGGTFLRAMESFRELTNSPQVEGAQPGVIPTQEKENKMDEKQFETFMESLKPLIAFVAKQEADTTARQAENAAVATAEEAVANFAAASKAIADAELLPSQVESLTASAIKGEDVFPLIESAKKIRDEALSTVSAQAIDAGYTETGRVVEGVNSYDFSMPGVFRF
jgi:hypothetical protein